MRGLRFVGGLSVALAATVFPTVAWSAEKTWKVHAKDRPQPKIVTPGDRVGDPPSDAIVLFDGKDLSKWEIASPKGGPPKWKIENGVMTIAPLTGSIRTKAEFGDCQLHIEWRAAKGSRSNSGVFFMSLYELQIYGSYKNGNPIYADGVAGSMYGQQVPLVNVCRPTGDWEVFDAVFRAPRFDADGKVVQPARISLLHNGVLVLSDAEIKGFTVHGKEAKYRKHAAKMPLMLQDHRDPVSFRNIWIRPLGE